MRVRCDRHRERSQLVAHSGIHVRAKPVLWLEDVTVGIEIATFWLAHGTNGIGRWNPGKETSMERQSTQHSPRIDDEMERETKSLTQGSPAESRQQDARRTEGPADNEPFPDAVVSMGDIELRSLLAASLRPSAFPGDRDALLKVAAAEHAEPFVVDLLYALPPGRVFATPEAVWEELGGKAEVRSAPAPPPREVETETDVDRETETELDADDDARPAPLLVQGAVLAVSVSVGAVALAVGLVREVCGRIKRVGRVASNQPARAARH
jgi:hypothetical protein